MKKTILAAAVLCALLIAQACKTEVKTEVKEEKKAENTVPLTRLLQSSFQVPLSVAQDNIDRYTKKCSEVLGIVPIKAYTIHAEDLMEVLGIPDTASYKYHHVRAYLGMDTLNQFKLYLTPVEGANLGVVPKIAGTDVILKNAEGAQYVLDLNAPCPATCDITSPLYYDNISKNHDAVKK